MVFEHIEKLKRAFTDKYVVVDATRPELARFKDATGLIKTVNMNGRALVEFDQFDNISWYDIELDFLKVVPKPDPKAAEKPVAEKPAAAAKPAAKPAAPKPAAAAGAKPSTADILAAARTKKGTGEPVAAAKAAPAAPKPAPAAAPAAGKKLSTADILAAARGKGAAPAAVPAVAPAPKKAAEPEPVAEEEAAEPAAEAAPVAEPAAKPVKAAPAGPKPTTIAEKIAYCRRVDAKG
jgi:hypothetical protein